MQAYLNKYGKNVSWCKSFWNKICGTKYKMKRIREVSCEAKQIEKYFNK
jgi:hypothetical protein